VVFGRRNGICSSTCIVRLGPPSSRRVAAGLGVVAVGGAGRARADVLYALSTTGLLRAIDPATGLVLQRTVLRPPGKVVTGASGLGAGPGGIAYALVGLGDDCALDPTRTLFAGGSWDGCAYVQSREQCEQSFIVTWGSQPTSCAWMNGGCEACGASCANTCVPPPPCLGSTRTQWAGFGAGSCRRFDGDAAGCAAAYYSDETGTFTCFESAGQCLACDPAAQVAGACTYGCTPPHTCAEASRDVFVGYYNCWALFDDAAACERAFQTSAGSQNGTMACVVGSDGYCTWCDANGETEGFCINTCEIPPACTGDATRAAVPACYVYDADPNACTRAYTADPDGAPAACFVNTDGSCAPCNRFIEREGWCINACAPPVCAEDPLRTTLLEAPADCHAFDADPTGCAAAYFVGRCGVSSCHYDVEASGCRPCAVEDPERCENACGPFEGLDFEHSTALVTVDLAAGSAAVVGWPGDWLAQPTPDATGTVHALTWYGTCVDARGLFRLDPSDLRPGLVVPLAGIGGGALAFHPGDGRLYRFATDGLFATDPITGLTTTIATDAPPWLDPRALTWASACDAFLVADGFDGLWRLDPLAGTLEKTLLHLEGECDEGDCATGLVLDGTTVCPPLTFPTSTTTITTTSTSSSTSTSTLPSELVAGRRLLLTDDQMKPRKRRLEVRSDDPSVSLGGGERSTDDPVLHAGTLHVVATSGTFGATYALADGWHYVRKAGRLKGYVWRGHGPMRKIVLRPGRLEVRGKGDALVQTLVTDPGAVQVVLQLGRRRWCLEFGGTFGARTPEKLRAHDAPAPLTCAAP
jgi:hypothetical protein